MSCTGITQVTGGRSCCQAAEADLGPAESDFRTGTGPCLPFLSFADRKSTTAGSSGLHPESAATLMSSSGTVTVLTMFGWPQMTSDLGGLGLGFRKRGEGLQMCPCTRAGICDSENGSS